MGKKTQEWQAGEAKRFAQARGMAPQISPTFPGWLPAIRLLSFLALVFIVVVSVFNPKESHTERI